jgi:GT2 family glycosyltransferase/glycosyltransferase involved in cell wall biosynthesis
VPSTPDLINLIFASGNAELNRGFVERAAETRPDLPLVVVAEFKPDRGEWVPFHVLRSFDANLAAVKAALNGRKPAAAGMLLDADVPLDAMRRVAREIADGLLVAYDEELCPISNAAFLLRRAGKALTSPRAKKWLRTLTHPPDAEIPVRARLAQMRGMKPRPLSNDPVPIPAGDLPEGVTVVIPSRDGKELLETLLPALLPQIVDGEIIVSDNGSRDGTAAWLRGKYPSIRAIESSIALSFARAVNAGISAAKFRRVLLLNNDMVVEAGFVDALNAAFETVPHLFCATAQIFFPQGIRREETGKAVWRSELPLDFPVRCDDPLPGEDLTWVLYGSGGCSLFDTAKLTALGGVSELYDPAYVEDMDFGYRAWTRGWPTVLCAGARVEHQHRATTSRFYSARQLDAFVEINYLRFLIHAIGSPSLFQRLWREGIRRLQLSAMAGKLSALDALRNVPNPGPRPATGSGALSEEEIFALCSGDIAIFPGSIRNDHPIVVVASPYLPFPLSHGGAVRIYNLMCNAATEWQQILIAFCDELAAPPKELLEICTQVILVRRHGTHYRRETPRPDAVEEFDSETFRAVLKQTIAAWNPSLVQLEFTWMAQYATVCSPAGTVLVEHDITFDLQQQLIATGGSDWELEQQCRKWKSFETSAWKTVDCVVTMSAKDEATVTGARRVACIPNGVDCTRFAPDSAKADPHRLLFIGSFAHLPNLLALEYFLREVWPLLPGFTLHIIAGSRPEYYLDFHHARVSVDLRQPGIELEGFVPDVRGAYRKAGQVLAPLTASAGTNIKVLEAMAMGRPVVSTTAGINGLALAHPKEIVVVDNPGQMAEWIVRLADDEALRSQIGANARKAALRFDWKAIAAAQSKLYRELNSD